ncbi:hypothetical protein [Actinomadura sp. HBU206391]|uniref:hypothetical protein n=1 Tax=Actinomadura sp. HBU206391 TaxID=2731692 RepID=UPI0016502E0E|nr:hypothetical protein [Actinomadura sp. HBU206391]MBC6462881.1 hypothetical protein [Actinomadura sp. HBU206391]
MLSTFEGRVVAAVAELLADRTELAVIRAGGSPGVLTGGSGRVEIGVVGARPDTGRGFSPGGTLSGPDGSRRVVPLAVEVRASLARRATGAGDAALLTARTALLEDVTLVVHGLDVAVAHGGGGLDGAGDDPGFKVLGLDLAEVTVAPTPTGDDQHAVVSYLGRVLVWPPGTAQTLGLIPAVDVVIESLPLGITADPPVVVAGGSALVRIHGVSGSRLADAETGARETVRLAVGVRSDLPPADRGAIADGAPAAVAGFRVVPVTEPLTVVTYTAPAQGPAHEEVAVHLAHPTGGLGAPLGAVTLTVRAAPP